MKQNDKINGYQNEYEICFALNGKQVKELDWMYRSLIEDLYPSVKAFHVVHCWVDRTKKKYDILISICGSKRYISIKKGAKNSVHREGLSSFKEFLLTNGVPNQIVCLYLKYHFADGTLNGSGNVRLSVEDYKKQHQMEIDCINEVFNQPLLLRKAIDRFILGNGAGPKVDAILFGVKDNFIWMKREDIIESVLSKQNVYSTAVHFGPLTVQPQDRCLNRNSKYESARFCVQLKWYQLADDIIERMNFNFMKKYAVTLEGG